ncbi:OmpA family protein [Streptomyces sp. NPDC002004]
MHSIPSRPSGAHLALTSLAAILSLAFSMPQQAAATTSPSEHRAHAFTRVSDVNVHSSGLALRRGAKLAPPKILDLGSDTVGISEVVGDQHGAERREETPRKVTFQLQAGVLFTRDSAQLSSSARLRLASIARDINTQRAGRVTVFGFTDNLGSAAHGDVLSLQRAEAVQAVLARELRTRAVRFDTRGFGERHPVASNTTEAGRQKNRRVEISFSRTGG